MPAADPTPRTTTDQLLAQVRDELRALRSDLAKARPARAPAKKAAKRGTRDVNGT